MPNGSDVDTQPLSPLRQQSKQVLDVGGKGRKRVDHVCIARPLRVAAVLPKAGRPAEGYFALTLDVIESITVEAVWNWSLRLSIPCRRAIHSKSV